MGTFSQIIITFNEDINNLGFVSFKTSINGNDEFVNEVWTNQRLQRNQVSVGTPTNVQGEISAINYVNAFNIDYNAWNTYEVTRNLNVVTIESKDPNIQFSDGISKYLLSVDDFINIDNNININVAFTYRNLQASEVLELSSFRFNNSVTNNCDKVKLTIQTSVLASKIKSSLFDVQNNTQNPFEIEILRGSQKINIELETDDGQKINFSTFVPSILNIDKVKLKSYPNGADAEIQVFDDTLLDLSYSLDGVSWFFSNKFTGLTTGSYTAFVRDQFGCTKQKNFEVLETNLNTPFHYFSKSNSLRYVFRKKGGVNTNRLIDENAFACEDLNHVVYPIVQEFLQKDLIKTQFKTNYQNQSIKIVDNLGGVTNITAEAKTNNINLKDKRDAIIFDYGNGKMGMYFRAGKIYDHDTGIYTGSTYVLNGGLPEWAKIGQVIYTDFGWLEIKKILPNNEKNAEVLVFDYVYTGSERTKVVSTIYNREEYNVYEFSIDCLLFQNKSFKVIVELSDPNFETLVFETETVRVNEKLKRNFAKIQYNNPTNTDVFYKTGIDFLLRLEIDSISDKSTADTETHKTDTNAILLGSEANEEKEIKFIPIPRALALKLFYALLHKHLFINDTQYVVSDTPESPERLGDSNLYVVKAIIVKAKEQYKSSSQDESLPTTSGIMELPNYLSNEDGFIKI